jgi:hypothetical protein
VIFRARQSKIWRPLQLGHAFAADHSRPCTKSRATVFVAPPAVPIIKISIRSFLLFRMGRSVRRAKRSSSRKTINTGDRGRQKESDESGATKTAR